MAKLTGADLSPSMHALDAFYRAHTGVVLAYTKVNNTPAWFRMTYAQKRKIYHALRDQVSTGIRQMTPNEVKRAQIYAKYNALGGVPWRYQEAKETAAAHCQNYVAVPKDTPAMRRRFRKLYLRYYVLPKIMHELADILGVRSVMRLSETAPADTLGLLRFFFYCYWLSIILLVTLKGAL